MSDLKIPRKEVKRFVALEQELFALANKHGISLSMDIRWPDGFRAQKRTLNKRECAATKKDE